MYKIVLPKYFALKFDRFYKPRHGVDFFKDVVDCALASRTLRSLTPTLSKRLPLAVQGRYQFFLSNKSVCMKVCCESMQL